jgi:hypothetical protein
MCETKCSKWCRLQHISLKGINLCGHVKVPNSNSCRCKAMVKKSNEGVMQSVAASSVLCSKTLCRCEHAGGNSDTIPEDLVLLAFWVLEAGFKTSEVSEADWFWD